MSDAEKWLAIYGAATGTISLVVTILLARIEILRHWRDSTKEAKADIRAVIERRPPRTSVAAKYITEPVADIVITNVGSAVARDLRVELDGQCITENERVSKPVRERGNPTSLAPGAAA
ncbi:MAG TPA: hypothetical protein VGE52_02370, partial [Pirellulales bacterium]